MISAIKTTEYLAVKINVTALASAGSNQRPLNIAFLLDNSGSMDGERLNAVKRTLAAARDLFQPTDQVTLVTFENKAEAVTDHLLLNATGLEQFYAAIDGVEAKGCTNLSAGFEKLLMLGGNRPYDAILLLTDGIINEGITSNVGLRTMGLGLGGSAITAIGYGADHNRILLRDLATASRGAYIFVDSESVLPDAMGDFLGGLRAEVFQHASLHVPTGWKCMELGSNTNPSYMVGNIVADRDYWVVFKKDGNATEDDGPIKLVVGGVTKDSLVAVPYSDCYELQEQVLRCRVSAAITAASDMMEMRAGSIDGTLAALSAEFAALSPEMLMRPLILRMQAQIAEILALGSQHDARDTPVALLARMSSGAATLSSQRGSNHYSSPCQRLASQQVSSHYSGDPV